MFICSAVTEQDDSKISHRPLELQVPRRGGKASEG